MHTLLLSARILAGIHSNIIDNKCSTCRTIVKEELNCNMNDSDKTVYILDDEIELCTCPLNLLSTEALSYYDRYNYYKEHKGAKMPSYEAVSYRYLQFINTYSYWYNKYQIDDIKSKPKTKSNKTDSNMNTLKAQFLNKKK